MLAAAESHQEPLRPKKKRKVAAATAAAHAAGASHDAAPHDGPTTAEPETKKLRKTKRKRAEGPKPQQGAAEGKPGQPSDAPEAEADVNASGAATDVPGAVAFSPAAAEEKKQSRSARRKQLKRRFRRLGVAPPTQEPSSSSHQPGLGNSTAANILPDTCDKDASLPETSDSVPPAKRLKAPFSKLKAQRVSEGHVYFADSGSEPDSAADELATVSEKTVKASLARRDKHPYGKPSGMVEDVSQKQKTADVPLANGVHTGNLPEVSPVSQPILQFGLLQSSIAHTSDCMLIYLSCQLECLMANIEMMQ